MDLIIGPVCVRNIEIKQIDYNPGEGIIIAIKQDDAKGHLSMDRHEINAVIEAIRKEGIGLCKARS